MREASQLLDEIPEQLIQAIQEGECVAFVGAGFSAAAGLPAWGQLLQQVAESPDVSTSVRSHVAAKVRDGSAHALDEAAQVLEDELKRNSLIQYLRAKIGSFDDNPSIQDRRKWLYAIPFRAIMTTNFDGILDGEIPRPEAYRSILRSTTNRWWDEVFWRESPKGAKTIKLHGDLRVPESIVLTRLDYRRRLYHDPAYMTFLRALLAQQTVLYLGFSFADAYLNELRSEVLSLLGQAGSSAPVAYAVINDVPEVTQKHFLKIEGVQILSYDTKVEGFGGFDRILRTIHDHTNPTYRFGKLLAGARILWIDHQHAFYFNLPVFQFLERAATSGGFKPAIVEKVLDVEEGIGLTTTAHNEGKPYDLIISRWGHGLARNEDGRPIAIGQRVLEELRSRKIPMPVLIFSSGEYLDENKKKAIGLGAQGYFFSFGGILRGIERVFAKGVESV